MFLSLDGTAWFQLLNFGIFYAILDVVFLRPVGEAIRKRRAYITSVRNDYDRYRSETQRLNEEADQRRAAARQAADETIAEARTAAETEAAQIAEEQGSVAAALVTEARTTVEAEVAAARAREAELSRALARTLLERATGALS